MRSTTRRARLLAVATGMALVLLGSGLAGLLSWAPWQRQPARPLDRLVVAGRPSFWAGVNYPWKSGQDFGTGGWGHAGVSKAINYQEIDADFANMAARGVRVVKWRVFNDGRYSPEFDDAGHVTGLDELFLPDLDAALEIAARHDLYLVLTLFASGLWTTDCQTGAVHMGGRAATLLDPARRRSLVEQGVVPMLRHLRHSDRVLAFEIIAEPEWGVQELHQDEDGRIKLPLAVVRDFVSDVARAIHRDTQALATVESNRFSNMRQWQGLGLDYYSFSWYDWLEPFEPLATPARAAGLDRPVVLGEYPINSAAYPLPQVLDLAYSQGYAGAFAWSFWSGDGFGEWRAVAPGFADWTRARWTEVNPAGPTAAPPAGAVAEQRYPYTYDGLEVRPDDDGVLVDLRVNASSGEPYLARAYLYELGNAQPLQEERMRASQTHAGKLAAHFAGLEQGKPYMLSLGIFSRTQSLIKWYQNLSTFALEGGQVTTPQLDAQLVERPCKS